MKSGDASSTGKLKKGKMSQNRLETFNDLSMNRHIEPTQSRYMSLNPNYKTLESEGPQSNKMMTLGMEGTRFREESLSPGISYVRTQNVVKSSRSYLKETTEHSLVNIKQKKRRQSKKMHEKIKTQKGKVVHITVNESLSGKQSDPNSTFDGAKKVKNKFMSETGKGQANKENRLEREVFGNRPFSPPELRNSNQPNRTLNLEILKSLEMGKGKNFEQQHERTKSDNNRYVEMEEGKQQRMMSKESRHKGKKKNVKEKLKDQINTNTGGINFIQTFSSASSGAVDISKANQSSFVNPLLQNDSSQFLNTVKGIDKDSFMQPNRMSDQLMGSPFQQSRYASNDRYLKTSDIFIVSPNENHVPHMPFYKERKAFVDSNYTFRPNSNLLCETQMFGCGEKIIIEDQLNEEEEERISSRSKERQSQHLVEFNISQGLPNDFLKSAHFTQQPQCESNDDFNKYPVFANTEAFDNIRELEKIESRQIKLNDRRATAGQELEKASSNKESCEQLRKSSPGKFTFNQDSHLKSNLNMPVQQKSLEGHPGYSQLPKQTESLVREQQATKQAYFGTSSQSSIAGIDPQRSMLRFNSKASKTDFGFYNHQSPYNLTSHFYNNFDLAAYGNPYFNSSGGYSVRNGSGDYMSGGSSGNEHKRSQRREERKQRRHERNQKYKKKLMEKDNIISILQDSLLKLKEETKNYKSVNQSEVDSRTHQSYILKDLKSNTSSNIGNGVSNKDDKSLKLKDLEFTLKDNSHDKEERQKLILENEELKKGNEALRREVMYLRKEAEELAQENRSFLGQMQELKERVGKERAEMVANGQEFRMHNAELEEKAQMLTMQNELHIKKLSKLKQKNGQQLKEFHRLLQEKDYKIKYLNEEIGQFAEALQKQKKQDEKLLQDHYAHLKHENLALKNQVQHLQMSLMRKGSNGNLTQEWLRGEGEGELSCLQNSGTLNQLKRSRSPQHLKINEQMVEDVHLAFKAICKELHLENILDAIKKIKDMKESVKKQRKERKLISNLQQMAKDYPFPGEKEGKKGQKGNPPKGGKENQTSYTTPNNNTIEDISGIQGLELPSLKEVWKWLKQLLHSYLLLKKQADLGLQQGQTLEAIKNFLELDQSHDLLHHIKLYKMKVEQGDHSLEMVKKLLGLPVMSGIKDIEYQIQVRMPQMKLAETRKSGSLVEKRK